MRVVALVLLLCASAGRVGEDPVSKVVELIAGLKVKIQADGKVEQGVYDKYACWCESTTSRKQNAIQTGETRIEELSKNILELNGHLGSYTAELKNLKDDIVENKETVFKAEEIRHKENTDFVKQKAALEEGIINMNKAIQVLGAGTSGFTPAMMETRMLTVAAGVRGAFGLYAKHESDIGFDADKFSSVRSFLGSPNAMMQSNSPHKGTYTTQSTAIQGILEEMYETFQRDLVSATDEETQRQSDFDQLKETKSQDHALLSDTLTKKTKEDGDDAKQLAEDQQERAETQEQVKTDKAFLETTLDGCKTKADHWAERTRLRTEELAGINQAINILTSDEAKATFSSSDTTFVQLNMMSKKQVEAWKILKKVSSDTHSVKLALLAMRASTGGHFDKVVSDVTKMIDDLREEEKADMDHRDWCESERKVANSKNEKLEYEMEEIEKAIERLENRNLQLTGDITATETDITDLKAAMATALINRNAENEEFKVALKDDTDAVMLIAKAIQSLSAFYENNDASMSLAQVRKHKQPEYAEDEDVAPASDFSAANSAGSQTSGVVGTLSMIKEDLENEMKTAREEEGAANDAYRKQLKESQDSMKAMESKINTMNEEKAANNKEIAALTKTHGDKDAEKVATDAYLEGLRPECDWIDANFVSRREARKEEIGGLETAKKALSVAAADAGLLATKARLNGRTASRADAIADLDATEKSFSFLQKK